MTTPIIHFLPLSSIRVPPDRIRKVDPIAVGALWRDIRDKGLLQPIMVVLNENGAGTAEAPFATLDLVFGEHRFRAFEHHVAQHRVALDGGLEPFPPLRFDGADIPDGTVPALFWHENIERVFEVELSENLHRVELPWQDRIRALARLHDDATAADPSATVADTSRKLAGVTGMKERTAREQIARANIVAKFLDDPDVQKCDSLRSAWNTVNHKVRVEVRQSAPQVEEGDTPHAFLEGDCTLILPELASNQFDLILSDPPYGVRADKWDQGSANHAYDDSAENALWIYKSIIEHGFRVCKEKANLLLFCDISHFHALRAAAEVAGWTPWPRPIIWTKGTEGMRPWGQMGFAYTYECILWATKGGKGLVQTSIDVLQFPKPPRNSRIHPAQKPQELLAHLIHLTSLPGDRILDPCAGSGSTFAAGWLARTAVTGIEMDEKYWGPCRYAVMQCPVVPVSTSVPVRVPTHPDQIDLEDIL